MTDADSDLDELIGKADPAISELVNTYEPYEAAYRAATASTAPVSEATNTATAPRTLVFDSTSAR